MSAKSKIVMSAAVLTLLGSVGAAGAPAANAQTLDCAQCSYILPRDLGGSDALAASGQAVGQQVDTSTIGNPGEDFEALDQGNVSDFVEAGMMPFDMALLYGGLTVDEFEYAPGGQASGLCLGSGIPVTLQECGASVNTTWIIDPVGGFDALISGATDSNFKHPFSLTDTAGGVFTLPLRVEQLAKGKAADQQWAMT